jgi:rhodanese-related sulfurtransferase
VKYGDRVRFVFRHLPLPGLHPYALKAAEAAECGAAQGKFWESLERFYAGQDDLKDESLVRYASEIGLDAGKFRACLDSGAMAERVQRDADDARMLGLRATPTFFIGQQVIEGPIEPELFGQLIRQELARTGNQGPTSASGESAASLSGGFGQSSLGTIQFGGPGAGCSEADAKKKQATEIRTPEARLLFEGNPKALFVDVREPQEYDAGRIAGALNVPVDKIQSLEDSLPKDRSIVLYESGKGSGDNICAAGRAAGRTLLEDGFSPDHVKVYLDGLEGWISAGLPKEP